MEGQRKKKVASERERKRELICEEFDEINKKKQDVGEGMKTFDEDIAKYSIEVEEKTDLVSLTKANSFQKTKTEKENSKAQDNALQKLHKDLKSLDNQKISKSRIRLLLVLFGLLFILLVGSEKISPIVYVNIRSHATIVTKRFASWKRTINFITITLSVGKF